MALVGPRTTGAHFVYTELKRRILALELAPGERLFEPALAQELQVSRTPLREAIRRLISENLLEQQQTGGVLVPPLDAREVAELYDVRAMLEALMAEQACKNLTAPQLDELAGLVERNAALVDFAEDAMAYGQALHAAIATAASNTWASRLHVQVSDQIHRYRSVTNRSQERRLAALAEHRGILAALVERDAARASALAYAHVQAARVAAVEAIGAV